jgi:hypothetical protein
MNKYGELSTLPAPTILFHYSYLFNEKRHWLKKKLEWKEPISPEFTKYCNDSRFNVALLVTESLRDEAEKLIEWYPFRRIYEYKKAWQIKQLSFERFHNFYAYYDNEGSRGSYFGDRWKYES